MSDRCRWSTPFALAFLAALLASRPASTQTPSPAWVGWVRCQVDVRGPGYQDQQIHTWTLPAGTPRIEGVFRIYPGTWSVVGGGSLERTQGSQTQIAQWATTALDVSAPIAVWVRADGQMFISARHAQLRAAGAVAGYQQQTLDGQPRPPTQVASEAFEWAFPTIDVDPRLPTISGSSTPSVNGSVAFMQSAGSAGTASCAWRFGQGAAPPAPPPAVTVRTVPAPGTVAPGTGAPGGPPSPGGFGRGASGVPPGGATPVAPVTVAGRGGVPTAGGAAGPTPATAGGSAPAPAGSASPAQPSGPTLLAPTGETPVRVAAPGPTSTAGLPNTLATSDVHSQAFTASGTFTVSAGVTNVFIEVWGGGAGGHGGRSATTFSSSCCTAGSGCRAGSGGQGGGSGAWTRVSLPVTGGTTLTVVIGVGGQAATDGGATLVRRGFTVFASAAGGKADGTGGAAATDMGDGVRPGNAGSPGGSAGGDFGTIGGSGGAGGPAVDGSVAPTLSGGGKGGTGQGLACGGTTATGVPNRCTSRYASGGGSAGQSGYALISW